jgi:TolB protein
MKTSRLTLALLAALFCLPARPGAAQSPSAGQVAIVETDGNIAVYDVATQTTTPVTRDGVRDQKIYSWPTWSTDGQLAYFGMNLGTDDPYRLGIFIKPAEGAAERVYTSPDEIFTYAYWAPGDCPHGNCRDLAVLYTMSSGELGLRTIRTGATFTITERSEGGPHYWDWSPDGQMMFWARYRLRLELYDMATGEVVETFAERQGLGRSVDWSPVDNRLLAAITTDDQTSELIVLDGDERQVLATGIEGILAFEWSPDGSLVAYSDDDGGTLRLINSRTGAAVATVASRVVGFFWSPDGSQIAYIAIEREEPGTTAKPDPQQPRVRAQWYVYNVDTDVSNRLAPFIPTRDMIYYLSFYDQFARSHSLWSPDSHYLVYGEIQEGRRTIVSLIDVTQPGTTPVEIAEGSIGIFSWE